MKSRVNIISQRLVFDDNAAISSLFPLKQGRPGQKGYPGFPGEEGVAVSPSLFTPHTVFYSPDEGLG